MGRTLRTSRSLGNCRTTAGEVRRGSDMALRVALFGAQESTLLTARSKVRSGSARQASQAQLNSCFGDTGQNLQQRTTRWRFGWAAMNLGQTRDGSARSLIFPIPAPMWQAMHRAQ